MPGRFCGSYLPDFHRCQDIALDRERMGNDNRLRPSVILYGEENPKGHITGELAEQDLGLSPEVVVVVGTALKVPGAMG